MTRLLSGAFAELKSLPQAEQSTALESSSLQMVLPPDGFSRTSELDTIRELSPAMSSFIVPGDKINSCFNVSVVWFETDEDEVEFSEDEEDEDRLFSVGFSSFTK